MAQSGGRRRPPLFEAGRGDPELSLNLDASHKLGVLFLDEERERGKVIKFFELSRF